MINISYNEFAKSFGTTPQDIIKKCGDMIEVVDGIDYWDLSSNERDNAIVEIMTKIETDVQKIGKAKRTKVWRDGWTESRNKFFKSNDYKDFIPKFIRPNKLIRFNQDLVKGEAEFELKFYKVFRQWLFKTYFAKSDHIYEFGCGSNWNLIALAELFADKELHGSDFVQSAIDIGKYLSAVKGLNIDTRPFNLKKPDQDYRVQANSSLFTIGVIEQLAGEFESFIDWILFRQEKLNYCIHVEPTIELYDENNLIDNLAIKFHKKRGYTEGFLPYLQKLEKKGRIEIIKVKRLYFGSFMMEGYNLIVWKVK